MTEDQALAFHERERSHWVKLRTLVMLRWVAIIGQLIALTAAVTVFDIQVALGLAVMNVGVSIIANLIFTFVFPENKRLSEFEALMMLMFDLLQLGLLLYLTGGLNNPFAVLLLAPVTIAATFLRLRNTAALGVMTILVITELAFWHLPLVTALGTELTMPLIFRFGAWVALTVSVVFLGLYARMITREMHDMADALLATQMALAREQKLTDLGGVVAAAAHELGTPLATIKLVSSELLDEAADRPDLIEDLQLIASQADRCRDILRSMGRAGKDDLHLRSSPIEAIIREAADPHFNRGKSISLKISDDTDNPGRQPILERRPEIIHGLRNLIQNAVDFAKSSVAIETTWTDTTVSLRINDDGKGYPATVIGRIGDPFVRRRRQSEDLAQRPGYEGMGLGLFIAKTLLERSGARLSFANGGQNGGAMVVVEWPREAIDPAFGQRGGGLGKNRPIEN